MAHEKVKTSDFCLSPGARRNVRETCPGGKYREGSSLLIPRDGELLKKRFEIRHAKEDHSDGIDDRRGCAAGGGGGCIYFAKDLATGRDVAIKFYSPLEPIKNHDDGGDAEWFQCDLDYSNKKKKDAFKKEQKIVAELSSLPSGEGKYFPEYIAKGSYRSKRPYYVMEKLQALTPAQYADEKTCEKIILEVCRAAQILSNHGKIALDIKPDNIMFRPADKHFVLVDMGLVADKDAYQKVSREALEKYSRLSLSAQCGTVGFFSELYSPHHEARMIYAIGGLIESLFGERMLPEWREIVFRCRRLNEQHCFSSLDVLIRQIRCRKNARNTYIWAGFEERARVVMRDIAEKSNRHLVRTIPWHSAVLDPKLRREGYGNVSLQKGSECQLLFSGFEDKYQSDGIGWSKVAAGYIEVKHGPIECVSNRHGLCRNLERPFVVRFGLSPCHEVEWKIKEEIRVIGRAVIEIACPGVVNINLVGSKDTIVVLGTYTTLINRTRHITEDQSTYHLGDFSYLNFRNGAEDKRKTYKMKVFQSLCGPSFVRFNGPKSLGTLISTQSKIVEKAFHDMRKLGMVHSFRYVQTHVPVTAVKHS